MIRYDLLVPELKLADYAGKTDAEALAILQAKRLPGPVPMTFTDLLGLVQSGAISQASFGKVWNHQRFSMFYDDVMGQNHYAVANLYPLAFQSDGTLSADEATALAAYANRTENNTPIEWAAELSEGHIASARQLIAEGA